MPGNNEIATNWIKKAENDLRNVRNNFNSLESDLPTDTMCFHCQQAIEKLLKAFLTLNNINYPRTHNIADLIKKAADVDESFNQIIEDGEILTPFAVEIRYPDDYLMPTFEETKEIYELTLKVRDFIVDKLSKDINLFNI